MPWGYVGALQFDPIEKKPFFHAYPGALALSVRHARLRLHCGYCQNWVTSQALRDPVAGARHRVRAGDLVSDSPNNHGAQVITSHLQRAAHHLGMGRRDLQGSASAQASSAVRLQRQRHGARCSTTSRPGSISTKSISRVSTIATIATSAAALQPFSTRFALFTSWDFWLEIVTLLVPGFNDSDDELTKMTEFLASVSSTIPWHVTAFHQDYKMTDPADTKPARPAARGENWQQRGTSLYLCR